MNILFDKNKNGQYTYSMSEIEKRIDKMGNITNPEVDEARKSQENLTNAMVNLTSVTNKWAENLSAALTKILPPLTKIADFLDEAFGGVASASDWLGTKIGNALTFLKSGNIAGSTHALPATSERLINDIKNGNFKDAAWQAFSKANQMVEDSSGNPKIVSSFGFGHHVGLHQIGTDTASTLLGRQVSKDELKNGDFNT